MYQRPSATQLPHKFFLKTHAIAASEIESRSPLHVLLAYGTSLSSSLNLRHNLLQARDEDFSFPLPATTQRGSVQQGLSVAGGTLGFYQLDLATDKRCSLVLKNRMPSA